jgi:hypothetical protein
LVNLKPNLTFRELRDAHQWGQQPEHHQQEQQQLNQYLPKDSHQLQEQLLQEKSRQQQLEPVEQHMQQEEKLPQQEHFEQIEIQFEQVELLEQRLEKLLQQLLQVEQQEGQSHQELNQPEPLQLEKQPLDQQLDLLPQQLRYEEEQLKEKQWSQAKEPHQAQLEQQQVQLPEQPEQLLEPSEKQLEQQFQLEHEGQQMLALLPGNWADANAIQNEKDVVVVKNMPEEQNKSAKSPPAICLETEEQQGSIIGASDNTEAIRCLAAVIAGNDNTGTGLEIENIIEGYDESSTTFEGEIQSPSPEAVTESDDSIPSSMPFEVISRKSAKGDGNKMHAQFEQLHKGEIMSGDGPADTASSEVGPEDLNGDCASRSELVSLF